MKVAAVTPGLWYAAARMPKKSVRKKRNGRAVDLRAEMWIAPDIRRIIVGDKDDRYAVADQFPGASNRMLDLADLALGSKVSSKRGKNDQTPVVEKEKVLSAAAGKESDSMPLELPEPTPMVIKSRSKS